MFEDCLPSPEKNGRPPFDKAAGVLVSLLIHGILGYGVYHHRFIVKVLASKKNEVRDIMIVPPLRVSIPKIVGGQGLVAEPPVVPEKAGTSGAARRAEDRGPEPAAGPETKAEGPAGEPVPPAGGAAAAAGTGSVIPSLSSKFQESMANRPKPSGEPGLSIALAPPGTPAGPPGVGGGIPRPDFSRYDRGAVGGYGGYGSGRGRGGGTGGGQRVGMSIPLKDYDLLPWASIVIDRIQRYWNMPAISELPSPARVRMVVVIKKSGELDSIEILEGTTIEVLDRSALEAIRGALPFPALPSDFPGDLLEITFEFAYHD